MDLVVAWMQFLFYTCGRSNWFRKICVVSGALCLGAHILLLNWKHILELCSEAVVHRSSVKKVFLEISRNSQKNTCARVSFLIKLQASGVWAALFLNIGLFYKHFNRHYISIDYLLQDFFFFFSELFSF